MREPRGIGALYFLEGRMPGNILHRLSLKAALSLSDNSIVSSTASVFKISIQNVFSILGIVQLIARSASATEFS